MTVKLLAAQVAYDANQFENCINICKNALAERLADPQFIYLLSSSYRRLGQLHNAKRALICGTIRHPGWVKFPIGLSEVEYMLGNVNGALEAANEAEDREPADIRLLGHLARCHAIAGKLDDARRYQVEFNRRADTLNRVDLEECLNIGDLWQQSKKNAESGSAKQPKHVMKFTDAFNSRALSELSSIDAKDAQRIGTVIGPNGPIANKSVRNAAVTLLNVEKFKETYLCIYKVANAVSSTFAEAIYPDGPLQLVTYDGLNKGHYSWHQDIGVGRHEFRRLTITAGVSFADSYVGGELQIQNHTETICFRLDQGDTVAFTSSLKHRVTPVNEGARTIAVGWFRSTF